MNVIKKPFQKIYGCDNICSICLDKNVDIFLPKCGHVCMCFECLEKIDINKNLVDSDFKIYIQSELPLHIIRSCKQKFFNCNEKVYTSEYGGMGCTWYLRRDFKDGEILGVFLHSDFQGQYGINHIPYINNFIEGYRNIIN